MPMNYFTDQLMKENPAYECFAFAANMPKWNTENPEVISYLIDQADRWTQTCKIDAWRLDVPDEVSPRFLHAFMEKMQCHNTAVYIIGEIWQSAAQWLGQSIFHGAMDYPLYFIIRDFALLQEDSLETFATRIGNWYSSQPESVHVFQWAFCSNHDVARALYYAKGNLQAVKTAYFLTAVLGGILVYIMAMRLR